MIALTCVCPFCGKAQCLTIKDSENYDESMKRIREGESPDVVFPNLNQLVSLINGEIAYYLSQGVDYFWVDCGPWHIQYNKTEGETDEQ